MKLDVAQTIEAVTRAVAAREHEGRTVHAVTVTRTYPTPAWDLWDALTNGERIPRWFLPISGELRLGGRYQLQGNAGGTITHCEPPHQLTVTWEYGGAVSWVTVRLREPGRGTTELELEQLAPADDPTWQQYGPGATGVGWELALMGLGLHLPEGTRLDPDEVQAWTVSDEGRAFVRESSSAWAQASIRFGTPEADALSAAERTTTAYTGAA